MSSLCWLALAVAGRVAPSTAVQLATPAVAPGRPSAAVMAIVSQLQADPQLLDEVERELAVRQAELAIQSGVEWLPRRLSGSGSGSGSTGGSASGSGGGCSFHSVFDLTCHPTEMPGSHCMFMDWMWFGLWLLVVVTLTILIESVFHKIEHVRVPSLRASRLHLAPALL